MSMPSKTEVTRRAVPGLVDRVKAALSPAPEPNAWVASLEAASRAAATARAALVADILAAVPAHIRAELATLATAVTEQRAQLADARDLLDRHRSGPPPEANSSRAHRRQGEALEDRLDAAAAALHDLAAQQRTAQAPYRAAVRAAHHAHMAQAEAALATAQAEAEQRIHAARQQLGQAQAVGNTLDDQGWL